MKKVFLTILILFLVTGLVGCASEQYVDTIEVTFYYTQTELDHGSDTPLLMKVIRSVSAEDNDYEAILKIYLNGPTTYDCVSPFPGGTELVEMYVDGHKANIVLSPHIGTLAPARQTVAFACLSKTVIELTKVSSVQIRLQDSLINGKEFITFDSNSFVFFDSMTQDDDSID